jgi:two-component system NarL family sensor kinase
LQAEDVLQKQQIRELQIEKELAITQSILNGQEEERKRLAKDLHDGLGGLLSGVKVSLATVKDNMVMSEEGVQVFERSLNMLDNSIGELRRIAHNMMPEALARFGLVHAVKDFCDSISISGVMSVSIQVVGAQRRLESSVEIILYRIIQELLNNALKHSEANKILVQLSFDVSSVMLTVEDDGKGFEKPLIENSSGAGWPNIKSRVAYLKGTIDVQTRPGEGTSFVIDVPV